MATSGYMFESGPTHMCGLAYNATTGVNWIDDCAGDDIKAALTNTSPATHYTDWAHFSDVMGELGTAGGYTAGGMALSGESVTVATDTDRYQIFWADDITWAAPFTAGPFQYIIIYKDTASPATSPLICYHNCGAAQTGAGGAFTYEWSDTHGVFSMKIPHA